jgi:1,2-diacylglycerol 3-beta-glucosyltransferase
LDLIVPPLSLLVLTQIVLLGLSAWAGAAWFALTAVCAAATVFHVTAGLFFCKAPRRVWMALAFAPVFVAWKIFLYLQTAFGMREHGWVRTLRPGEGHR